VLSDLEIFAEFSFDFHFSLIYIGNHFRSTSLDSYLSSGESFASVYGKAGLLKGVSDPKAFIAAAQAHGYSGDSTSTFLSIEGGIQDCLTGGQSGH
jgi:hypothetical protein